MVDQLALDIVTRLSYSADQFVLHSGVRDAHDTILSLAAVSSYRLSWIFGERRTGKTHFSLMLLESLQAKGMTPRLVEGEQLPAWISGYLREAVSNPKEIIIVDDIDRYLSGVTPGNSGPFVALTEKVRAANGAIILLSSQHVIDLPCDAHTTSRLFSATSFSLEPPGERDLSAIISTMARQRGIRLTDRKVGYLALRLGRNLPGIERYLDRLARMQALMGAPAEFPLLAKAL